MIRIRLNNHAKNIILHLALNDKESYTENWVDVTFRVVYSDDALAKDLAGVLDLAFDHYQGPCVERAAESLFSKMYESVAYEFELTKYSLAQFVESCIQLFSGDKCNVTMESDGLQYSNLRCRYDGHIANGEPIPEFSYLALSGS